MTSARMRARHAGGELRIETRGDDPCHAGTAKMLGESALCLAVDRARLPARAGILTPACAFGEILLERLQRAGLVFQVVSRSCVYRFF
ncbi:MAG: saccharopine dehydrogenase [Myxococcaceae bacterium]|nr:saccharopine dehydrogenase [Myxococcaceae bacterium]